MSSGLMDTEVGGEQTAYESIKTVTEPTKKSGGQLGEPATESPTTQPIPASESTAKGAATAEKIRYGQAISENGMGGQTTSSEGSANQDSAYGGASTSTGESIGEESGAGARGAAGYGGEGEMSKEVGA